jgi:lipopolysaccharide transport system ATP-binding protein
VSAIVARGLGKQYRALAGRPPTLREVIVDGARAPLRWLRGEKRPRPAPFWALEDVSFQVSGGEAVGIIGKNGAGKSTLLKVLSRVTAPSRGEARLRGRVASLLEVGTGFHGELTGRENIFLNGALMGMSRSETRRRFDEIVAFAEVEKFLDTEVKHYSSGMYLRLAFAVAAHLSPDILIVDEILAVGDAAFQKKCLGKMQSVASGGRTVLFVSHNLAAVSRLCSRALLLQKGHVAADGSVSSVVAAYLGGGDTPTAVELADAPGSEEARLLGARLHSEGLKGIELDVRHGLRIEVDLEVLAARHPLHPTLQLYDAQGQCLFVTTDEWQQQGLREPGRHRASVEIPAHFFAEGMHSIDVGLVTTTPLQVHAWERGLLTFHVVDPADGTTARGNWPGEMGGAVRPRLPWRSERIDQRAELGADAQRARGCREPVASGLPVDQKKS